MINPYYNNRILMNQIPLKDGNRDTILQWIYDIHVVEWYATFIKKRRMEYDENLKDKIQDIYLMLCEIPQSKWDEIYAQGFYAVGAYVTGVVQQQLVSTNSKCYKQYDRFENFNKTMDESFWENYGENN